MGANTLLNQKNFHQKQAYKRAEWKKVRRYKVDTKSQFAGPSVSHLAVILKSLSGSNYRGRIKALSEK